MVALIVGLNEIQRNPNLTFVAFIAFVLIGVLGIRFGLYAYWNGKASGTDAETMLWGYLFLVGLLSALYGAFGVARIVFVPLNDTVLDIAGGLMLGTVLCLALVHRSVYVRMAGISGGESGGYDETVLPVVFVLFVVGPTVGMVALSGTRQPFAAVHGAAGLLFLGYGYRFGQKHLAKVEVQGTLLDTLLRHLLPVLLFASLIPIMELTWVAGVPRTVVLYVQIVFVIMTATTLMTATIKLRQNLAGMR